MASEPNKNFDWNTFTSLKNPVQLKNYLDENLSQLGVGSSRAVYLLDEDNVIKIAINVAGAKQNRKEVQISKDPKYSSIIAKAYEFGPNFLWTKNERVFPLEDETGKEVFKQYYGVSADTAIKHPDKLEDIIEKTKKTEDSDKRNIRLKKLNILKLLQEMKKDYKIALIDFEDYHQWGKTKDGRIVVLDYGYDYDIYKQHYTKSQKQKLKDFHEYIKALNSNIELLKTAD